MSAAGSAANEASRQVVRKLFESRKPETLQEASEELTRAENWRMVSGPVAFAGGWLAVAASTGASIAAPGIIFGGLALASWLERRREREAREKNAGKGHS